MQNNIDNNIYNHQIEERDIHSGKHVGPTV